MGAATTEGGTVRVGNQCTRDTRCPYLGVSIVTEPWVPKFVFHGTTELELLDRIAAEVERRGYGVMPAGTSVELVTPSVLLCSAQVPSCDGWIDADGAIMCAPWQYMYLRVGRAPVVTARVGRAGPFWKCS